MKPRKTAVLIAVDAAYLAGLIDGEGTIALTRIHRGQNRQLAVTISSTEICMLEWVRSTLGVGKITRKQPTSIQHAPGFTFCIANRQALSLLAQVEPYLRSYKARRARLALERYLRLTPRNGKYTASLLADRHDFEREFSAISIRMSQSKSRHALLAMPAEGS